MGAPDGGVQIDTTSTKYGDDSESDSEDGCCRCQWPRKRRGDDLNQIDVSTLDAQIEAARVKVANAVVKIVKVIIRVPERSRGSNSICILRSADVKRSLHNPSEVVRTKA